MNVSLILIALGVVAVFTGSLFWVGLGFIAVGVVVYSMSSKKSSQNMFFMPNQERIMQESIEQEPQQLGFTVRQKTPEERMGIVKKRKDIVPIDEHGVADIPLPVPDELERYIDFSYKKKVR